MDLSNFVLIFARFDKRRGIVLGQILQEKGGLFCIFARFDQRWDTVFGQILQEKGSLFCNFLRERVRVWRPHWHTPVQNLGENTLLGNIPSRIHSKNM